eukprot:gene3880-biopygen12277
MKPVFVSPHTTGAFAVATCNTSVKGATYAWTLVVPYFVVIAGPHTREMHHEATAPYRTLITASLCYRGPFRVTYCDDDEGVKM